jgi:hypothetical protein
MTMGAPIHQIPDKIGALVSSVSAGGRTVTRAFVDRWFGPPETAETAYLRFAECTFHLVLTESESKTIFFFFHEEGPTKVVLDATISFRINSSSDQVPSTPFSQADIGTTYILPSFLIGFPSRADLDRFGFGAASTDANTALFALGPEGKDLLAIMNAEAGKKAQIRYSPGAIPGSAEPQRGNYSLAWVLAFIRTLSSWMESELTAGERLPALVAADERSVPGVLFYLLSAYVNAASLVAQPPAEVLNLPDIFQKTYTVDNYQVDLKMRLAADGSLSDAEDYETSQLTLRMRVRECGGRAAEITAIPNELATSGPLLSAITEALEFNVPTSDWRDLLGLGEDEAGFVPGFLQSARSNAIAFRIGREEDADHEIVVLTGMLADRLLTVVLTAKLIVDMSRGSPTVDVVANSVESLAVVEGDGSNATVGFDAVEFLLTYISNFRHWMGVLQ